MSTIDPIDSTRLGRVEPVRRPLRRDRDDAEQSPQDDGREPEPDDGGESSGSNHVDIRV